MCVNGKLHGEQWTDTGRQCSSYLSIINHPFYHHFPFFFLLHKIKFWCQYLSVDGNDSRYWTNSHLSTFSWTDCSKDFLVHQFIFACILHAGNAIKFVGITARKMDVTKSLAPCQCQVGSSILVLPFFSSFFWYYQDGSSATLPCVVCGTTAPKLFLRRYK